LLAEEAERRILSPARTAGFDLRPAGITGPPRQGEIVTGPWGKFGLTDHLRDPAMNDGQLPIPPDQIVRLRELDRVIHSDLLWLAHGLPADWQPGQPLPPLVPTPRRLREADARRVELWAKVFKWIGTSAKAVGRAAGSVAAVGLDPVVLGGIQHPHAPAVYWVVLAQWDWE
jgi:hypothetical protein